ncbi:MULTISPECIES: ABC transporter ATP-binding protein [unclassified Butyrivibrio]|uniref:ABC transporter ATP-binding protein n=1 Tax=unclassified Butyrivibrio TaxID=2639466 RepID=UPI0003B59ABE|nr:MULTISPECIES: ABC transporter ATP-binding protein [unclassified Butyrivibrio]SEK90074.1 ATP-binding cassette, subfamily B [Butyrivibrio sp. ob235]
MKKYLIKNWWRYLIGGISLICSTAIDVMLPFVTLSMVDDVIVGRNMDIFRRDIILFVAAGLGRAFFQFIKEFLCDMSGCRVASGLRKDMMKHIFSLNKGYFDKNNTGELMARVKDDAGSVWDLTGFVGMLLTEATVYFIGVVICMITLNWKLSIIPLAFMPPLAYVALHLEKKLGKDYDEISERNADLTKVVEENISGVRTVKAFSAEGLEMKKFDEKNEAYGDANKQFASDLADSDPLIGLIPKIMQVLVVAIGGYAAIKGSITYGTLVAFVSYSIQVVWPIENLGWMLSLVSQGLAGYKKINKVMKTEPEITDTWAKELHKEGNKSGEISFDHVSFNIDGKTILNDVSFNLGKGKTLGIMGATGAGKSTIVNLIERFYDVTSGSIKIEGKDIKKMPLSDVRAFSSVVTQDVFLFSDTITENVRLGFKDTMDLRTVKSAIKSAHAQEFVEKITDSYDAVIGERGIGLSGGQKQRLSIARALAKKADLLVLDDSTSALDMETEAAIQQELQEKNDMSKIIIGHRISSVKDADEILVLENGRVAERGTHSELIRKGGLYYSTYEAQYGDYHKAMAACE